MHLKQISFLSCLIYLNCGILKLANANAVFRFDFNLYVNENSFKTSLNVGQEVEEEEEKLNGTEANAAEELSSADASPILMDIWSKQAQLNATAGDKLQATRVAVLEMKNEMLPFANHSEFIALKIPLLTNYLTKVAAVTSKSSDGVDGHERTAENQFLILQDYVQLVDDLLVPPTKEEDSGEHSLHYMFMKLCMKKHKLIVLQKEISVEVLQAMEKWQTYVKKQLIDISTA